jgi:hypothetical protein
MTTSASFNTVERIIRFAMTDAGKLQEGSQPSSQQYAVNLQRLQDLVNMQQTQGVKLWLLEDVAVPLVAGTSVYNLSPTGNVVMTKPLRVEEAYYYYANGQRRPIQVLAVKDWVRLGIVTDQGQINAIYVDHQPQALILTTWLIPDVTAATGTLHVILRTQITQYVSLTDQTLFPIEWFMALRWMLAEELATGQPDSIVQRCTQKAAVYREMLESWDVDEADVRFTPNPVGMIGIV